MTWRTLFAASIIITAGVGSSGAQWTHRYPKMTGFAHHVYVEGYDFPTIAAGPTSPAVSPDTRTVAFSARGWIWLMDVSGRRARRLTAGAALDARPAWSPDGTRLAFVRDDTRDTAIVEAEIASRGERTLVDTPAADLDPAYSADGRWLFYSSAEAGDLDIWRLDRTTGLRERLTTDRGLELRPQPLPDGGSIVYTARQPGNDEVVRLDLATRARRVLSSAPIASLARPALDPAGRRLVVPMPEPHDWSLRLVELAGGPPIRLIGGTPITPAWGADGFIYYSHADDHQAFHLSRVPVGGGPASEVTPTSWEWGVPTARVMVETSWQGRTGTIPARVSVVDAMGHPALPDVGQAWFDGQNGTVFSYSPGALEFEVPAGPVRALATHGFEAPAAEATGRAEAGQPLRLRLELKRLIDMAARGWYSGDHHFHLNYGGPYVLTPRDLVPMARGEGLDVATPLVANLHTRFSDDQWFDWKRSELPLVAFGQEVRPHFLGHTGHIGIHTLFWPWFWGPGYPVYGRDDRPTAVALAHTRSEGGVSSYVHPVMIREPFPTGTAPAGLPLELVPDAMAGDVDTIEVACLWSDELGTTDAWYRLLDVGVPLAPSAGTDAMTNFFRTMAIGTTRVYVKVDGPLSFDRYLAGLKAGRSFVTTGPLLTFSADGVEPGGVVAGGSREVSWTLDVQSPLAFDTAEVLVNGVPVWHDTGVPSPGQRVYRGTAAIPAGGWMAARVYGGAARWPTMDSYPFAHTAPIWFGSVGSTDPAAARRAAGDLLRWMDVADKHLVDGYGDAPIPELRRLFADARQKLQALATR